MKDDGERKDHGGFLRGRRGIAGIASRGEEGGKGAPRNKNDHRGDNVGLHRRQKLER